MDVEKLKSELSFKAVRSSGAGGQHVNKVSSKVILSFDIAQSHGLTAAEKELLKSKLQSRLSSDVVLSLQADEDRSQIRNKQIVSRRFFEILKTALVPQKQRKITAIPRVVKEKRREEKRLRSAIKQHRRRPDF